MSQIEEENIVANTQYCVNCLCYNDIRILQCYKLHCEQLKTIFQKDSLMLCYLCKKIIENAESCIQSVLNNQILLADIHNISDNILEKRIHPTCSLNVVPFDPIELSGNVVDDTDCVSICKYGIYKDCKIKSEPKHGDEIIEDDRGNDYTDNFDFDVNVKEEESGSVKIEPVLDLDSDLTQGSTEVKNTKVKNTKVKKKRGKLDKTLKLGNREANLEDICTFNIEMFHVSIKQCKEELDIKSKGKNFLNAPFKCTTCVTSYRFKANYERHMLLHSKDKGEFECDICKQRIATNFKLTNHVKNHQVRHRCLECGLIRIHKSSILDHYTSRHTRGLEFKCRVCHKTFPRGITLEKHMKSHKNKERLRCMHCSKTYKHKGTLRSHMSTVHSINPPPVMLRKQYVCKVCGKSFSAPSHLKTHSAKHSVERNFYCVECDKKFKTENSLKQHLKIATPHVDYKDLPLQCTHCGKRFAIRRDLERHTNRMHLNIRPFNCDVCGKAYLNRWGLKNHKNEAHQGYKHIRRFPCPMCDKLFSRQYVLKSHIRTHTGERPYQCSKCPAKFSQSGIMNTHIRLVHLKLTRDGKPKTTAK